MILEQMNKPLFSVALIAKNEELTIPRMVASLSEFQKRGGEIWVLDTGSTDKTVEVSKNLGCRVEAVGDMFKINIDKKLAEKINKKFVVGGEPSVVNAGETLFDFASARNYIAKFADNDMVATPDCDEIFTKFDIDKLNEVIANGSEQLEYEFVFSHDSLGNPVVKFRHCKFYNRKKLRWVGVVHEVLQGDANRIYLGEDIIKLEHYQNEKTNRSGYLKGLAVDCYQNPDNDRNSHYFAREMMYQGMNRSAIKEFLKHISMNRWPAEASQSMLYVGDCYKSLGDFDEMLKWYSKSIEKEMRREPLIRLAEYYFFKKMYAQTVAYCEAALTLGQLPFYSNFQPYYENVPHELLYISYWWLGNKEKSREHYLKAVSYCPNNPRYISDSQFYSQTVPEDKKISIVMPFKNKVKMTEECVASLIANTPNLGEIILIDDHSEEKWTADFPFVKYYLNKGSMVTDAWNYGASLAKYNYICWCNNDLLFSPDWATPLVNALDNDTWLVSPYHTAGLKVPDDFPAGKDKKNNMGGNKTGLSFLGSCFMMEKKNWLKVGPIDERLRLWSGDNYIYESTIYDFGRQVKEIPESYIHHLVSQTINRGAVTEQTQKDMDTFDKIYAERGWGKRSKHPELSWTSEDIDLRLKLPIKDITKMRVLNIGVGDCWSGLAKQLRNIKFGYLKMVDVYEPYLDAAVKMDWMAEKIEFESISGVDIHNWKDYDLVMIFDVLEHIEKEESIRIVNEIQAAGVKLLVFGPLEKEPRKNSFGVASQDHISFWTEKDFRDLGLTTELLPDFHHEDGKTFPAIWSYNYSDIPVPKISFIIPTLGRDKGLERCLESIKNLNYPQDKVEVIVEKDSYENRTGVPKLLKKGVAKSTGEWIVFASDDTEFSPNSILEALKVGEKGYVAFNTGELLPDGGNRNEHFMIRKDIIAKIGDIFDIEFNHVGVDNLLAAQMDKLGIFVRAERAVVIHHHFSKGADYDRTYQTGWAQVEEDRKLLAKKLLALNS
jgi:glycosyltransferase involved in cell wall biosynthesis